MTDHLAHLRTDVDAILRVLDRGSLDAPVTACPGWSVRELVEHLGAVHRWATEIVQTGAPQQEQPYADKDLTSWFAEGAEQLLGTLGAADPDAPCWSFTTDRTAGFWRRRQALETAVHRWDAEQAVGAPAPLDAGLAADGVTEVVALMAPRQVKLGRVPAYAPVLLRAVDTGQEWLLGEGDPVGSVEGSAHDLLLLLWKRPVDGGVQLTGEAAAVLQLPLTP